MREVVLDNTKDHFIYKMAQSKNRRPAPEHRTGSQHVGEQTESTKLNHHTDTHDPLQIR